MSTEQLERIIKELASSHPHSIRRVPDEAKGYRCFVHAFELVDSPAYQLIAEADEADHRNVFCAGSLFASFMMDTGKLVEIGRDQAQPGDLVVYLGDDGTPKHAGKIASEDGRVRSQWGGGLFLEHGLWEVTESYGNTVKYYQGIVLDDSEKAFLEYSRSRPDFLEFVKTFELEDLF